MQAFRARPFVDVVVEGLDIAPKRVFWTAAQQRCGSGLDVADLCGVDLSGAPEKRLAVGGAFVDSRMAEVRLCVADQRDVHEWLPPVWFCEPGAPAFGLLGLSGFFDQFEVTIAAYEERIDPEPISA